MNEYEITITVDTNDADYVTSTNIILGKDLVILLSLIEDIKKFEQYRAHAQGMMWTHEHNYPFGECLRRDLGEKSPRELYNYDESIFDLFERHLPSTEYGFHTIESIYINPVKQKTRLL